MNRNFALSPTAIAAPPAEGPDDNQSAVLLCGEAPRYDGLMRNQELQRPKSAFPIYWSDEELALIGWLTTTSSQCEMQLQNIVKAVERLDFNQWKRLDRSPAKDLAARIKKQSPMLDSRLDELASEVMDNCTTAFEARAKVTHAFAGEDPATGEVMGYHPRRGSIVYRIDIESAAEMMGALSFSLQRTAERVADLIIDGVLPGGSGRKGMTIRWRDRDVKF